MRTISIIFLLLFANSGHSALLKHDTSKKTVLIADESNNLQLLLNYGNGCKISAVNIKGKNTISSKGVYTSIKTETKVFTSIESTSQTKVTVEGDRLEVSNIVFGNDKTSIAETWIFTVTGKQISWEIRRQYLQNDRLHNMAMPVCNFSNLSTWKGGILNTYGMVWCLYLGNEDDA